MEYSTPAPWEEISETGIIYGLGSLYDRFQRFSDPRKAKSKRYSLVMLMVLVFLAILSGKDTPVEIADWAKNHAEELAQLLGRERSWMPHHNTYRRVFQEILSEEEFERLLEEYHQQASPQDGEVLAIDGKALRGTRTADQERSEYVLSVYAGQTQHVKAQEVVETKENEIVAAPKILAQVQLMGKIVTGDAMHTQKTVPEQILQAEDDYLRPVKENQAHHYQAIQRLFTRDQPKPGVGKIDTDFLSAKRVSYGHGRVEILTIQTSEMLNEYLERPGVCQVYRLERKFFWLSQDQAYKTGCEVELGIYQPFSKAGGPGQSTQRQTFALVH